MSSNRPERVAQEIQAAVADLLTRGALKDPRIGFITLTGVKVSPDLSVAQVFYSMIGTDQEQGRHPGGPRRRQGLRAPRSDQAGQAAGVSRGLLLLRPVARGGRQDRAAAQGSAEQGRLVATTVDGVLVVDKPSGPTSFDVVQRGAPRAESEEGRPHRHARPDGHRSAAPVPGRGHEDRPVHHRGDQGATRRRSQLGATTDTLDADGQVLEERPVPPITAERLEQALAAPSGAPSCRRRRCTRR